MVETGAPMTGVEQRIKRRGVWPAWLQPGAVTFSLGLLGSAAYAILYSFDLFFLMEFGTSPEEVGVSQAALVVRATIFAAIVFFFLTMLGAFLAVLVPYIYGMAGILLWSALGWLPFDRRRLARAVAARFNSWRDKSAGDDQVHLYSRGAAGDTKRQTWAVSILCATVVTVVGRTVPGSFFGNYWDPLGSVGDQIGFTVLYIALLSALFGALARIRHALAITVCTVALFGIAVLGAMDLASTAGEDVANGPSDFTIAALFVVGLDVRPACFEWTDGRPLTVPANVRLYLGHANGVLVLADREKTYRVMDSEVKVILQDVRSLSAHCSAPHAN
ncbi:hypothetical protein [Modestobacter altitudinis]|uniref:hypothetical protein n=1 Tax=Modestobacter altitudinis TaxID=2213158 RepID=UPI00110CA285|nr:hypothetical protein [Modestobacter altitudinis]